jgi:hypothetical protein
MMADQFPECLVTHLGAVTDAKSIAEILTRLDLVPTGPPPKSVGEFKIVYDI